MQNKAEQLRQKADALQGKIDDLARPRLVNTRKRREEDEHRQRELKKYRTTQAVMRKLADMSDAGGMPHIFQSVPAQTSKFMEWVGQVLSDQRDYEEYRRHRGGEPGERLDVYGKAMRELMQNLEVSPLVESKGDKLTRLMRDLGAKNIPGYFRSPRPVAERVVDLAEIEPGMNILEPEAGDGALVDVAREKFPNNLIDAYEVSPYLQEILRLKGNATFVGDDILATVATIADHRFRGYDRIIMNPPFEDGLAIEHVRHCYDNLLAYGGRLVAVMPPGIWFRKDKKHDAFRNDYLDQFLLMRDDLPVDSFKESGTGTSACIIVLEKERPSESLARLDKILDEADDSNTVFMTDEKLSEGFTPPQFTKSEITLNLEAFKICGQVLAGLAAQGSTTATVEELTEAAREWRECYSDASVDLAVKYLEAVYLKQAATPAVVS